mgnify:CR=1 FL=1
MQIICSFQKQSKVKSDGKQAVRRSKLAELRKKKLEEAAMHSKFTEWKKLKRMQQKEAKCVISTMIDDLFAEAVDGIEHEEKKLGETVIRPLMDDLIEDIAKEGIK